MKKKHIVAVIYILLVYLAVATNRQGIYNVEYMSKYYLGIAICSILGLFLIIKQNNIIYIKREQIYMAKIMFLPILIVYVYSLLISIYNKIDYSGFATRSFGLVAYCLLAIVQAYIVYSYFKEDAIIYTFIGIVLNYLTSIIVALKNGGINEFISILTNSEFNGSVLEMHEVAPIITLFLFCFLYQLYFKLGKKKDLTRNIVICIIILIFSMKRILFVSCTLTIFVFWILRKKQNRILKWIGIISLFIIFIGYSYIFFIKSGLIYEFLDKYNINSMSRAEIWNGIRFQYEFTPFYLGHGLGYTSIWMENNWQNLNIIGLTQSTGLHNDILKFYIDFGFIGTFIYLFNLLYLNSKRIAKKISYNSAILYFTLISLQIFIWFTDVVSEYHNFQWIFYLIIFSLFSMCPTTNNNEKKEIKNPNYFI